MRCPHARDLLCTHKPASRDLRVRPATASTGTQLETAHHRLAHRESCRARANRVGCSCACMRIRSSARGRRVAIARARRSAAHPSRRMASSCSAIQISSASRVARCCTCTPARRSFGERAQICALEEARRAPASCAGGKRNHRDGAVRCAPRVMNVDGAVQFSTVARLPLRTDACPRKRPPGRVRVERSKRRRPRDRSTRAARTSLQRSRALQVGVWPLPGHWSAAIWSIARKVRSPS